jgi:tripeptide aminopeptidase
VSGAPESGRDGGAAGGQHEGGAGPGRATVDELLERFLELVAVPSPSGQERAVSDLIQARLRAVGLSVSEDQSAAVTGAASGNLVATVRGTGGGVPIAFSAHMDTVPIDRPPTVVVENGVVHTDGETILGADDKAAVTVLLRVAEDLAADPPAGDVSFVISASEEVGLKGAAALDVACVPAAACFVFDSEGPVGTIVMSAPTLRRLTVEFRGRSAHAGIEPENGRSAVVAAARAVAAMRLGRLDEQTTANVGLIEGGSAVNVVPERCVVTAEARSRDEAGLAAQVGHMVEACNVAAAETGVDVTVTIDEDFRGYVHTDESLPVRLALAAFAACGVEPHPIGGGGGSDANVFNLRGLPAATLGVGFEGVHSPQERLAVARLADVYRVAHSLVRAAGAAVL